MPVLGGQVKRLDRRSSGKRTRRGAGRGGGYVTNRREKDTEGKGMAKKNKTSSSNKRKLVFLEKGTPQSKKENRLLFFLLTILF